MSYESLKGHETTVLRNVTAVKTEKVQGKMETNYRTAGVV